MPQVETRSILSINETIQPKRLQWGILFRHGLQSTLYRSKVKRER